MPSRLMDQILAIGRLNLRHHHRVDAYLRVDLMTMGNGHPVLQCQDMVYRLAIGIL